MFEIFNIPHADPLGLPFTFGPWPIFILISSYLLFVLKLGPEIMKNREPFKLRVALKVYNIFQILYNSLLLVYSLHFIITKKPYDFNCIVILPLDHEFKDTDRLIDYLYYINKIIDLMDTVFFVLRKSYKQITALHLIHHVYMATAGYFWNRIYGYGGHFIFAGLLNLFVHIVMYTYYYLSSQKPQIRKSAWWKQYITVLQLVQFVLMFSHSLWTLLQPNCDVPYPMIFLVMCFSALLFIMFVKFYRKTYTLTKKKDP
ncbi:elongation of very long chain fatty acids protein F-like [Drosophila innubila]|uniref:elongation of very long chain fatty acids protein F-like n=1 Tax=Drosophila innubila TaxID=198719 RepID=UPI00148E1BED|nr:elongation of very long chain fatty acids protein F-like [Drosophila innubila]